MTQELHIKTDVSYAVPDDLPPAQTRRKLDLYLPGGKDFPVLVWFHGGGLTRGDKSGQEDFATALARRGIGVIVPNYRLSPESTYPSYIEDAATAVSWVKQNISERNGNSGRVFVGGHSAGGYLALMLAMDNRYLAATGMKPEDVAGYIPVSGQTVTHFTIREEKGLTRHNVIADEAAPVYYTRANTQPILTITGDRDCAARLEENAFFVAWQKEANNPHVHLVVIPERDHTSIRIKMAEPEDPGANLIVSFIQNPDSLNSPASQGSHQVTLGGSLSH